LRRKAAQAKSEELAATEIDALLSADAYAAWRAERAAVEIERLSALAAALEGPAAREYEINAADALRKRHAGKLKANAALADRIRLDIARINEIAIPLLAAVVASDAEDRQLNGQLPDDIEPVLGADHLARGRLALPRKEIAHEIIWLWVKRDSHFLFGEQDAVESRDGCSGLMKVGMSTFPCVKVPFEKVTYHPAEPVARVQPILHMKLPQTDGPGFAFDGSRFVDLRALTAELDRVARPKATAERPIEIELVPISTVSAAGTDVSAEGAN
jgi:hypothetical protein